MKASVRLLPLVSLILHVAHAAKAKDIQGVYSLSKGESTGGEQSCPQVVRYRGFSQTGIDGGYIRIPHSNISMDAVGSCGSPALNSYTSVLDSVAFTREFGRNSDVFNFTSNNDRGLLGYLRSIDSLIGVEMHGDLICGNYVFRSGTIVAFLRNTTVAAPALALDHLLYGATYLLMIETNQRNPKRCVYRTQSTKAPEKKPDCFPAHAAVVLEKGAVRRMDALPHGALVHTGVSGAAAATTHSRVFAFSHRDSVASMRFLRFTTASGARLTISGGHYIFSRGLMRAARTIRIGDMLDTQHGLERVHTVDTVHARGIYNPHTESGTMLVGDDTPMFRVSCYTENVHPRIAHLLLAPIRLAWRVSGGWHASNSPLRWLHTDSHLRSIVHWLRRGPAVLRW